MVQHPTSRPPPHTHLETAKKWLGDLIPYLQASYSCSSLSVLVAVRPFRFCLSSPLLSVLVYVPRRNSHLRLEPCGGAYRTSQKALVGGVRKTGNGLIPILGVGVVHSGDWSTLVGIVFGCVVSSSRPYCKYAWPSSRRGFSVTFSVRNHGRASDDGEQLWRGSELITAARQARITLLETSASRTHGIKY